MRTCPNCNASVSPGLQSCNSCGTPLNQQSAGGFCGSCGTPLPAKYSPCPQCGHVKTTLYDPNVGSNPQPGNMPAGMMYKNEGTTLVLSIILGLLGIQGVGHLYIGRIGRGVALLIGSLVLLAIGIGTIFFGIGILLLVGYFILFIWQIVDSKKLCREYNQFVHANGRPPW